MDKSLNGLLKKSILQYAIQGKLVPQIESEEPASILLEKIQQVKL
jgi:type I restriction enzyme S subunit